MNNIIISAIQHKQRLTFKYNGKVRTVEPHCYGQSSKGNEVLRAFQLDDGWKLFDLEKISEIAVLDEVFTSPRDGYQRSDKNIPQIYCQV